MVLFTLNYKIFTVLSRTPISAFLFFIVLCSSFPSSAQQEKDYSFNLKSQVHYGFIIPHRTGMKNLIRGHVKSLEIHYDIPTYGKKEWQQLYNYPSWGFSWYFADLANSEQLGFATGIFPYINITTIRKKIFQFNYHLGWGLGYFSKPFNQEENYKNIVIGSKLNAIIALGAESKWKISSRASASLGISFTHFSNGSFTVPNLGINIPSVHGGMSYYFGNTSREYQSDSIVSLQKKYEIAYIAAGGLRAVYPLGSTRRYPAFSLNATFGTARSQKNQFLIGYDLFYNTALFDYFERAKIILDSKWEMLQTGISLNYMAKISKVSIITGMGIYIYTKYKFDGPFYHRIGMRYKINEHLFVNVTLKSHFFKADFSEWGIGYRL